jgi:hypothetical protein
MRGFGIFREAFLAGRPRQHKAKLGMECTAPTASFVSPAFQCCAPCLAGQLVLRGHGHRHKKAIRKFEETISTSRPHCSPSQSYFLSLSSVPQMATQRPIMPQIVTDGSALPDDPKPKLARRSSGATSTSQQDKIALEDAGLRSIWEDQMKEVSGPRQPHHKAVVLLISWAPELDELQTSDEVDKLGNVFTGQFNYTVVKARIEKNDKIPQHQISKYLADFVYNHDCDGALLIIYYAGHGIKGDPGELTLAGQVVLSSTFKAIGLTYD